MHADVRITLGRFDHGRIQRRAPDRIDVFVRIDVVGREMQCAGFFVNHPASHRNCLSQYFVGDSDLLQRMNSSGREREIDRSSANHIAFARIAPALVKIDLVPASSEVRRQQSAGGRGELRKRGGRPQLNLAIGVLEARGQDSGNRVVDAVEMQFVSDYRTLPSETPQPEVGIGDGSS